ncbi:NAD(P)-binding protein [Pseudovirgaria hyperparasitica]|uniref:NAD(P)-binding protein n=1 Tax=Pseudovirgaria hyperparasitica TaxID=470096 RepID=A0A6A6WG80_9PEZI|nr:NAD(P)-binding protein [Pseudovirgaria hyperparasitica]KAF2761842.1 NAD(P)-binding protein [Pseudovirgaria hyperparasitica]
MAPHQTAYDVEDKVAIVTGAGSGINHALTEILLQNGCSVVMVDLRLRPEAEATLLKYPHPAPDAGKPSAIFLQTDLADWAQLQSLFDRSVAAFGKVNIVVNGAAVYEPPWSTFWNAPGISPHASDSVDCNPGVYKLFAINTMAPIRLSQIAMDYWLQNRDIQGNLMWVASVTGYVHMMQTPLYCSSKAAIISIAKSFGPLRQMFGIRNAAACPGPTKTPLFDQDYCRDQLLPTDIGLTQGQAAEEIFKILTEAKYGDGNIVEIVAISETQVESSVQTREVVLESLYPNLLGNHHLEENQRFSEKLMEKGMRDWMN